MIHSFQPLPLTKRRSPLSPNRKVSCDNAHSSDARRTVPNRSSSTRIPRRISRHSCVGIISTLQKGLHDLLRNDPRKLLRRMDTDVEFVKRILFELSTYFHLMIKSPNAVQVTLDRPRGKVLVGIFDVPIQHIFISPCTFCKVNKLPQIDAISLYRIW